MDLNDGVPASRFPVRRKAADTAFLSAIALLASVPAWHIDWSTDISETENRRLAPFPALATNGIPNIHFGQAFETWYQDRFWGRSSSVRLHSAVLGAVDGRLENGQAFGKKGGWLFLKEATKEAFGWDTYSEEQKERILSGLERQNDYLAGQGVRYCFLLAPVKATIYGEQAEWRFHRKGWSRAESLLDEIRTRIPGPVVWPKEALLRRKGDGLLYHPADTHWNMAGAREAFFELLRALDLGDFIPDDAPGAPRRFLEPTETEDPFDLARVLGIDVSAHPYSLPAAGPWHGSGTRERIALENPDAPIPLSILIVGDSFRCRLGPWAAAYFQRAFVVHRNQYEPGMVETFRPDIVVGEYAERYLEEAGEFTFENGLP